MQEFPKSPQAKEPTVQQPDESGKAMYLGLKFAGELGYMIAVPAVLLGFGGAYLDKRFHTTPLFILIGLVLAFTVSMVGVVRKVKEIVDATPDPKRNREASKSS